MEFFIIYTDTCQVSTSNDLLHSTVYHSHLLGVASLILALFPGVEEEEEEEKVPGTHALFAHALNHHGIPCRLC